MQYAAQRYDAVSRCPGLAGGITTADIVQCLPGQPRDQTPTQPPPTGHHSSLSFKPKQCGYTTQTLAAVFVKHILKKRLKQGHFLKSSGSGCEVFITRVLASRSRLQVKSGSVCWELARCALALFLALLLPSNSYTQCQQARSSPPAWSYFSHELIDCPQGSPANSQIFLLDSRVDVDAWCGPECGELSVPGGLRCSPHIVG